MIYNVWQIRFCFMRNTALIPGATGICSTLFGVPTLTLVGRALFYALLTHNKIEDVTARVATISLERCFFSTCRVQGSSYGRFVFVQIYCRLLAGRQRSCLATQKNLTAIGTKACYLGPCGGKSTVQVRLSTWFENLGWKVYRVPETATLLLGGGVRFDELNEHTIADFQENLLKTLLQIEQVYFDLSQNCPKPCLIICDRGAMDPSAFIDAGTWDRILAKIGKNNVQLRDSRYDQIIHLVTAAIGAEEFYSLENNAARTEGLELARKLDAKAGRAWLGHPYYDVIDNSSDFEEKCRRCLSAVSARLGIDIGDRLMPQSKRLKFLVRALPSNEKFGEFQDFDVIQNYLKSPDDNIQERLRKRGQNSHYTYMVSRRTSLSDGSVLETRRQINDREYQDLLLQADRTRFTAYKLRRCFIWNHQYFQMDVYQEPCHERCRGLILMETYSAKESNARSLPPFVDVVKDVTDDVCYSMYNLTLM